MTDADRLRELRDNLISAFEEMDELGLELHPMTVNQFWRVAELLDIPVDMVPTEGRALGQRAQRSGEPR